MKLHHTEVCITYIYRVGTSKKEADKQVTHQWSRFGSYSNANALKIEKKVKKCICIFQADYNRWLFNFCVELIAYHDQECHN